MDIYDPEKIKKLQPIHQEWKQKVTELIERNPNQRKILLNTLDCGTGKTTATEEVIFSDEVRKDCQIIWLSDRHLDENDEDNTLGRLKKRGIKFVYLQGIGRDGMCFYRDKANSLKNRYMNIDKALCDKCDRKNECRYKKQFEELEDKPDLPLITVQHYINTDIIRARFENSNLLYKVLVFDENPILKMFNEKEIRGDDHKNDFDNLYRLFADNDVFHKQNIEILLNIICALRALVESTRSDGIHGKSFVKKFITYLKGFNKEKKIILDEVDVYLDKDNVKSEKNISDIKRLYKQILYGEKDTECKDILDEILFIARTCVERYLSLRNYSHNLQFQSIKEKMERKGITTYPKKILFGEPCKLPNVPIVVTEAKGKKKAYEYAFKCDIEVFNKDVPSKQNIYQDMGGFYWKESLDKNEKTRDRILNKMLEEIGKRQIENKICICTYKGHYEDGFKELLIEGLHEIYGDFDENNISSAHFGNLRGSNRYIGFGTTFLIGTHTPDSRKFPWQVGLSFLGEKEINADRKEEKDEYKRHKFRYKDSRYQAFVDIVQGENEQWLGRRRAVIVKDKILRRTKDYVFSMLPLSVKVKKVMKMEKKDFIDNEEDRKRNELRDLKLNPSYVYLSHLQDGDIWTDLYHKLRYVLPFKNDKPLLHRIHKALVRDGQIENRNGELYKTEKGKEVYYQMRNDITRLEFLLRK